MFIFLAKKTFFCLFFPFNSIYYLITINMSFLAKKLLFCPFFYILSWRRLGTSHLAILFEKYFTSCIVRNYIEDITRWRDDMNFIFEWQRENKIHIIKPPCNVLFII